MIIFTRTKNETETLAEKLRARGYSATAINGDVPQATRERTVEQLKSGKLDILVATDVAARGLDVERISHVVNFDIPTDTESYVHRIGRTGRAGRTGIAVTFVDWDDLHKWALIARALDLPIEPAETYSSSPHLFTDLDIPAGTKGRLNSTPIPRAEKAAGRPPRDSQPREPRGESAIDKPAGSGRNRQRRRRPSGGGTPTS